MKLFFHETMSIKSLAFERGVTADNRAYMAPPCSAQIPLRGTSDTLVTLSGIMLRQVTIRLYPIIISNLIGAKK